VTLVKEIVDCDGKSWKVKASVENGYRLMQVELPAVFTVTRELNTPRTLSFSGIIKARKKEIEQWSIDELGVADESVGLKGSPTIVSELSAQEENKRQAEMITGTRDEKADMLVQKLVDAGVL
jgi:electron transfer flavoprotein beta subunit